MTTHMHRWVYLAALLLSAAELASCNRGEPAAPISCYRRDGSVCTFTQPDGGTHLDGGIAPDRATNDQSSVLAVDVSTDGTGLPSYPDGGANGVDGKDGPSPDGTNPPRLDAGADGDGGSGNGSGDGAGDGGGLGGGGSGGSGGAGATGGAAGAGGFAAGGSGGSGLGGNGGSGGSGSGGSSGTAGSSGTGGRDAGVDAGSVGGADAASSGPDARDASGGVDVPADTAPPAFDTRDAAIDPPNTQGADAYDAPGPEIESGALPDGSSDQADSSAGLPEGGQVEAGVATCPAANFAKQFGVSSLAGLAVDPAGNQFVVSSIYNTVNFNGASLTSLGGSDMVLAKLDPATGAVAWTKQFSGSPSDEAGTADQAATGVAIGQSLIGVIGTYSGGLQVNGTTHIPGGADSIDFLLITDLSGAGQRAIPIDTKNGQIQTIAGNPASDDFVLCGYAGLGSMTALGITATYATGDTGADIFIAKVDGTTGIQRWAHQYTGVGTAFCNAVAMDASGLVYAAGKFNGTSTETGLPTTYTSAVFAIWVAEFDSTGAISVIKSYSDNIGKQDIKGLAIDSNGDVAIAGALKNHVAFGGTTLTVVGTNTDGFVAKLKKSDLTPLWAKSWGDSATQEADSVAFNSAGDVVIVGAMNGTIATLGTGSFTSAGQADAYWVKFNGDGTNVCAGRYGESLYNQSAALVAISSAATGAQKDMVNIVGLGQGTFDFAPGMPFTTIAGVPNAFVLQLTP